MNKKNGSKFTKEYKQYIKQICEQSGLEAAFQTVKREFPDVQKRTVRTWVDEEFKARKQATDKKVYKNWKEANPEAYEKQLEERREHQRNKLREDEDYKNRQYNRTAKWREDNENYHKDYSKQYWIENKEDCLEYKRTKRQNDLGHRMVENTRAYLYHLLKKAFKGQTPNKEESTIDLIGCTKQQLVEHLRNQYKPGMTDENYGEWHIDHIKPCALFDLTDPDQRRACFHFSNLQPLWAAENLAKSDSYEEPTKEDWSSVCTTLTAD